MFCKSVVHLSCRTKWFNTVQFNLKTTTMYILEVCEAAYNGDCTKIGAFIGSLTVKGQQSGMSYEQASGIARGVFNSFASHYLKSKGVC